MDLVKDALAGLLAGLIGVALAAGFFWVRGDDFPWSVGIIVPVAVAVGGVISGVLRRRASGAR